MMFSTTSLRSAFDRPALTTCIVAPLAAGTALLADMDGAFARGGGSTVRQS